MKIVRSSGPSVVELAELAELLPSEADLAAAKAWDGARHGLSPVAVARVTRLDREGARVWLALESLQVTGSFKVRGALFALERLAAERGKGARRVIAASAGNHGAGVAYASRILGIEATVVVPKSAPRKKIAAMLASGARVIEHEGGYDAAEAEALRLAAAEGVPFLSPYDDPDVLLGNGATLGFEIARAVAPATVIAPIGGGGLATGLACALPTTQVWGAQSEASPAFALSLERGEAVTALDRHATETLADGLEGGIAERAFARARGVLAGAFVATEDEIASAMRFAFRELGLVVEGSAAVALTAVLDPRTELPTGDLAVVLTGRNVDPARLAQLVC